MRLAPIEAESRLVQYVRGRGGRRRVRPNQFTARTLLAAMTLYAVVFALADQPGWLLLYAILYCAGLAGFALHEVTTGAQRHLWVEVSWAVPIGVTLGLAGAWLIGPLAFGLALTSAGLVYVNRAVQHPPEVRPREVPAPSPGEPVYRLDEAGD